MLKNYLKKTQRGLQNYAGKENSIIRKPYIFLLSFLRPFYYTNEFLLINGLKRNSKLKQKSIIFFTVHKSGSTLVKNTIITLVGEQNLEPLKLSGYLSKGKQEKYYNDPVFMKRLLKENGYFYGAFRSFYNFPDLHKFKIVLLLRDPRDVLTSYYFSTLFNHPLSRKEAFEERKKYEGRSIDEFVLTEATELNRKYRDYCDHLIGLNNVLFLKYEDMITNFKPWLQKLSSYLELNNNEKLIDKIVSETSFKVEKEDKNSFIRNIKSGDHLKKLKPETIEKLSEIFKDVLITLDYI